MEWAAILLLAVLGLGLFVRGADRSGLIIAMVILIGITGAVWWRTSTPPKAGSPDDPANAERPLEAREHGYVSSDACRSCHPAEYASWKHSYHESMTQVVTPETMLADWDGVELDIQNRTYRLEQDGDQYWVDMVDPQFSHSRRFGQRLIASENMTQRVRRRVVQSTGSHHQQIYWFSSGNGRELLLMPFTWLVPEKRWIPYDASLMRRKGIGQTTEEWNQICLPCHATAGQPRPVAFSDDLDTHVAELGISCESCHGPAEAHIEHYRNPLQRYQQYGSESDGSKIVNPANLGALASSQVCAQCHSHYTLKGKREAVRAAKIGHSFRPGDDYDATRALHARPEDADSGTPFERYNEDAITWPDGMIRTAGRDYHGLIETPCFASGEYSCLSCHSMHSYEDRSDQLKPGMRTNAACLQCHAEFEEPAQLEAHTHHGADSSGSLCYDCHMPHSNYALLKGVRSHSLNSPNVKESIEHGRPNACNLCHMDQTLAWTREYLDQWYGQQAPLPEGFVLSERSAAVDWLLEGDAAQRGLVAWAMSRPVAQQASGSQWMAPLLAQVLNDKYPAVSLIAQRTLMSLPGFEDVPVTLFDGPAQVLQRWTSLPVVVGPGARAYQKPSGELDMEAIDAAYSRRNQRPVNVAE
jgi:hypothetical protein